MNLRIIVGDREINWAIFPLLILKLVVYVIWCACSVILDGWNLAGLGNLSTRKQADGQVLFLCSNIDSLLDRIFTEPFYRQEDRKGFEDRKQDLRHVFKQDRAGLQVPACLKTCQRSFFLALSPDLPFCQKKSPV